MTPERIAHMRRIVATVVPRTVIDREVALACFVAECLDELERITSASVVVAGANDRLQTELYEAWACIRASARPCSLCRRPATRGGIDFARCDAHGEGLADNAHAAAIRAAEMDGR